MLEGCLENINSFRKQISKIAYKVDKWLKIRFSSSSSAQQALVSFISLSATQSNTSTLNLPTYNQTTNIFLCRAEIVKKLNLRKFDPIVNQYVVFNEAKLSSGKNRQSKKWNTCAYFRCCSNSLCAFMQFCKFHLPKEIIDYLIHSHS